MKVSSLSPVILEKVLELQLSSDRWAIKQVLSGVDIWGSVWYIFNKGIHLTGES